MKKQEGETRDRKCPNCQGDHPASYRNCPAFKTATKITKAQFLAPTRITYAEAAKKYHQSEKMKDKPVDLQNTHTASSSESTKINNLKPPPTESKQNETGNDSHDNCMNKEIFLKFLRKCEEVSREKKSSEAIIKCFFSLIGDLAHSISTGGKFQAVDRLLSQEDKSKQANQGVNDLKINSVTAESNQNQTQEPNKHGD